MDEPLRRGKAWLVVRGTKSLSKSRLAPGVTVRVFKRCLKS
jgi:hypothetical protein